MAALSKKFFISIFILLLLGSCSKPTTLEKALALAGDNRLELEKVLTHFKDDSLKYKAACFLIGNMPGHCSYKDTLFVNSYYDAIDSIAALYYGKVEYDSVFRSTVSEYAKPQETIYDIEFISGDYLIANIDSAFSVWQNAPWAKHVDFDEFCEYILPYKIEDKQTLDDWRGYFSGKYEESLDRLPYNDLFKNLATPACQEIINRLRDSIRFGISHDAQTIPIRRMNTLAKIPYGPCDDYTALVTAVLRAKGMPVVMDYTPQWPFRSFRHAWNMLLINYGKNVGFNGVDTDIRNYHREDHTMAKVFRKTYSGNKELMELLHTEKHVPETFRNPFIKDVTSEYLKTVDVEIPVKDKAHKYVYLAVFDNANWIPIHWAKTKKGKAVFRDMGKNIAYLPVAYGSSGIIPLSNPFIVDPQGKTRHLDPDTTANNPLVLHRKYPLFGSMYLFLHLILNIEIQASNNASFRNAEVLYTTNKFLKTGEEVRFDQLPTYRYWRFYKSTPGGGNFNISEIYFFQKDSTRASYGKVIGTEGSYYNRESDNKEAAFDGNVLTMFDAPWKDENWVGMDFGKPTTIERIIYFPRNDGNSIEIGDEYELVYWNDTGWQSFGKQVSEKLFLQFEGCPGNALFLLHNHTKGREERIFTYENNEQRWW